MSALVIRPMGPEEDEAVWRISLEPGVIETTMALPSMRLRPARAAVRAARRRTAHAASGP